MRFNLPKAKETPKNYKIVPWSEEFRCEFPVEKVKKLLKEEKISLDRLINKLNFDYNMDRDKCILIKSALENEPVLVNNDQEVNLTINIPFCVWRCFNCTNVMYDKTKNQDIYPYFFDALLKELESTKKLINDKFFMVKNIAFTGNILALEEDKIEKIFNTLNYTFCNISIEVGAPEFVTEEKLKILKKYNVSRIIINALTFNTQTLRRLCRRFEFKDLYEAYKLIVGYGFETSFELVVGLLDENQLKLERNLELACELGASNIDLYSSHCRYIDEPNKSAKNIIEQRKLLDFANSYMLNKGYIPYFVYCSEIDGGCFENVGWAINNMANKFYIEKTQKNTILIGCGTNALNIKVKTNTEPELFKNPYSISQYVFGIDEIIQKKKDFFN